MNEERVKELYNALTKTPLNSVTAKSICTWLNEWETLSCKLVHTTGLGDLFDNMTSCSGYEDCPEKVRDLLYKSPRVADYTEDLLLYFCPDNGWRAYAWDWDMDHNEEKEDLIYSTLITLEGSGTVVAKFENEELKNENCIAEPN